MKQDKVTTWFEPSQKPVRVGMYQVKNFLGVIAVGFCWSYWDGKKWGFQCDTKKEAFDYRNPTSCFQSKMWRGLTHEAR